MPKCKINKETTAFGQRLTALLAEHGILRHGAGAYLANKYGVSTVTANAWINGEHKAGTPTVRKIAKDHGTTFDALYFGVVTEPVKEDEALAQVIAMEHVLSAIVSAMAIHRPAEARDVAGALRRSSGKVRNRDLVKKLIATLDAGA